LRFAPASIELRRAQILLILAALVPTSLALVVAICVLVLAHNSAGVVLGILALVFTVLGISGAVLVQIFVRRGDSMARLQNDFVSSVSHELRTPLTSIRMFVETLAMGRVSGDPAESQRVLGMLAKEVSRLESLVERVLELAKLEAGKRRFELRPTKVDAVIEGATAAFEAVRLAGGGPGVALEHQVEPGLMIKADQGALAQALLNLLLNAYKYTGDEKRIRVQAQTHGRKVEIAVTDNGPGISRGDQRVIFDRFVRGRDPVAGTEGTGMGLAVVNLIVRAHAGRVEVVSPPGQGATFRLILPREIS
jgi:two-component system phosphate regulon sensor histidine kinase PhoR